MKIKQVCELTGLTDRAIRYYIEEGLIAPHYTENYLGRKAYDFTEADVESLCELATLRRFGFSVEDIKRMKSSPAAVDAAIDEMLNSKESQIAHDQELLTLLSSLPEKQMTVSELARWLAKPDDSAEIPEDQGEPDGWERIARWCRNAFTALMALLALADIVSERIGHARYERYAGVEGWGWLILTLLPLLALLALSLLWMCGAPISRRATTWLLVGCLLWQPPSYACAGHVFGMSETTDIRHYMDLDVGCGLHQSYAMEIFPRFAHESSDSIYYYRYDASMVMYDVYAEWETYDEEELRSEIARAEELFASGKYGFHFDNGVFRMETENWQLIMCVDPMRAAPGGEPNAPFRQMTKQYYHYTIFAWNEETGRVRYCHGDYFFGPTPCEPYYLSLEW